MIFSREVRKFEEPASPTELVDYLPNVSQFSSNGTRIVDDWVQAPYSRSASHLQLYKGFLVPIPQERKEGDGRDYAPCVEVVKPRVVVLPWSEQERVTVDTHIPVSPPPHYKVKRLFDEAPSPRAPQHSIFGGGNRSSLLLPGYDDMTSDSRSLSSYWESSSTSKSSPRSTIGVRLPERPPEDTPGPGAYTPQPLPKQSAVTLKSRKAWEKPWHDRRSGWIDDKIIPDPGVYDPPPSCTLLIKTHNRTALQNAPRQPTVSRMKKATATKVSSCSSTHSVKHKSTEASNYAASKPSVSDKTPPAAPHRPIQQPKRTSAAPPRRDRLIFNASDLIQSHVPPNHAAAPVIIDAPPPTIAKQPAVLEHNSIKLPSNMPLIDYAAVPIQQLTNVKRGKQLICSVLQTADKIEHADANS